MEEQPASPAGGFEVGRKAQCSGKNAEPGDKLPSWDNSEANQAAGVVAHSLHA